MKEINKEEMFTNLKSFLKTKGIELQEGSYSERIRKGCDLLTDTVNMSQRTFDRAKSAMDKGLDQVRQTIHEKTAPKPPVASATSKQSGADTGGKANSATAADTTTTRTSE